MFRNQKKWKAHELLCFTKIQFSDSLVYPKSFLEYETKGTFCTSLETFLKTFKKSMIVHLFSAILITTTVSKLITTQLYSAQIKIFCQNHICLCYNPIFFSCFRKIATKITVQLSHILSNKVCFLNHSWMAWNQNVRSLLTFLTFGSPLETYLRPSSSGILGYNQ